MDQSILKKVRDLLALQKRAATDGEAKAATFALGKLLAKHQLDLASIETDAEQEQASPDSTPLASSGRMLRWRIELAIAVSNHLNVACWLRSELLLGRRQASILLCGCPSNTSAVHALYNWLSIEAQRICAQKGHTGKRRHDWLLGFALGVDDQLRKATEQASTEFAANNSAPRAAIVLASQLDKAKEARDKITGGKCQKGRPVMVHKATLKDGYLSGRGVHLGKSLGSRVRQPQQGSGQ